MQRVYFVGCRVPFYFSRFFPSHFVFIRTNKASSAFARWHGAQISPQIETETAASLILCKIKLKSFIFSQYHFISSFALFRFVPLFFYYFIFITKIPKYFFLLMRMNSDSLFSINSYGIFLLNSNCAFDVDWLGVGVPLKLISFRTFARRLLDSSDVKQLSIDCQEMRFMRIHAVNKKQKCWIILSLYNSKAVAIR